jgi:signal transduction histidine kinase
MGTQPIRVKHRADPRGQRASFRRLFVWYCLGMLATMLLVTTLIEGIGFVGIVIKAHGKSPLFADRAAQIIGLGLVTVVPLGVLAATVLFFTWQMGLKISQPVQELMRAVEKIRQQDLDFTITYRANNELGDLCMAFNDLRHELQASLEREWRKQEEMRMQMAALSHDLRTPVTIIQGHIEGLARAEAGTTRSQRLERYLPVLEESSQRMSRLLNDLLLVAALEQTSVVMQPQAVQLEEELARKARVYQLQAEAQGVAFTYQCPALAPAPVYLDLHRVEQILDNLFENALRYTPPQGQISLTYTYDARLLSLVLRDTGCGIAPEELPHVFEKFYHGQARPHAETRKAAGLGLYTCKLLADTLGGTITIRNHPDGGCAVTVCLPLVANAS